MNLLTNVLKVFKKKQFNWNFKQISNKNILILIVSICYAPNCEPENVNR